MRSRRSGTALLLLATASCSFVDPPSHFFDAHGIETIAVGDDLRLLTLVGSSVYYLDGQTLYRVPANGPSVTRLPVGKSTQWAIDRLASNGTDLVAWCNIDPIDPTANTAWFVKDNGEPQELPSSNGCSFISTTTDSIVLSRAPDTSGDGEVDHFDVAKGVVDLTVPIPGPHASRNADNPTDRVQWIFGELAAASAEDGTIWLFDDGNVARPCAGAGCLCVVSASVGTNLKDLLVFGTGDNARVLVQSLNKITSLAGPQVCCDPSVHGSCVDGAKRGIAENTNLTLVQEHLLTLREGTIWQVTALKSQDADIAVGVAAAGAHGLAASSSYAYYIDGAKLQRTPIQLH